VSEADEEYRSRQIVIDFVDGFGFDLNHVPASSDHHSRNAFASPPLRLGKSLRAVACPFASGA
jgi:hypothetical protein